VSKEHVYAYEAGYRDGSINYELEHCPACKNVADLQEALAENEKLRESVKRLMTQRDERLARAEAENAKLRKLVTDAHACKENDGCCEDCYADEGDCPIELRMRELGVEVD
jgi:hypothetical protein